MANLESYLNKYMVRYGYSDIDTVGKVVGTKGKATLVIQRVNMVLDPNWKPEFITGGFAGHCVNQHSQKWLSFLIDDYFEYRIKKNDRVKFEDEPHHFYDYNF